MRLFIDGFIGGIIAVIVVLFVICVLIGVATLIALMFHPVIAICVCAVLIVGIICGIFNMCLGEEDNGE